MAFPEFIPPGYAYVGDAVSHLFTEANALSSFFGRWGTTIPPTTPPFQYFPSIFVPPDIPPGLTLHTDGTLDGTVTVAGVYIMFATIHDALYDSLLITDPFAAQVHTLNVVNLAVFVVFANRAGARYRPIYGGMAS